MLGRYATYVGSSPYRSPSIFAMLGHLEIQEGVYGVKGGTYELISGLTALAQNLGVQLLTGTEVTGISVVSGAVEGVDTAQGFYPAKTVIAGGDVLSINKMLLPEAVRPGMTDRRIEAYEPSLSGLVTLAGVPRTYDALLHHTVFFSRRTMNRNSRISSSISVRRSSRQCIYATPVIPSLRWRLQAGATCSFWLMRLI
ncbi:phytoene desaturase family protein [Paenibacillus rhizoplanae]